MTDDEALMVRYVVRTLAMVISLLIVCSMTACVSNDAFSTFSKINDGDKMKACTAAGGSWIVEQDPGAPNRSNYVCRLPTTSKE